MYNNNKLALKKINYVVFNLINVRTSQKTVNDKVTIIKLTLFKIDLNPDVNNQDILNLTSLLNCKVAVGTTEKIENYSAM